MRPISTVIRIGFLALGVATLAMPSLAQTGAPAGSGDDRNPAAADNYPGNLLPGAVMPPYLASPPYVGSGAFIALPTETTGSSIRPFGPLDTSIEARTPSQSRKSLIDEE
jgi:hypothetical protein